MYFRLLDDVASKLKMSLLSLQNAKVTLVDNRDKCNLVKFYCALSEFGKEMLDWEVETFEIVLGNKGFGYDEIMDIVGMAYIVRNPHYVFSNRHHFENAIQILNDLYIDTSTTELQPPHYIIWAIIGIMSLFNSPNLPVIGDAAYYIVESFREYGWTQPPAFLIGTHLEDMFGMLHPEYLDIISKMGFQRFAQLALSIREPKNGFENYVKFHAPIIKYVDDKLNSTYRDIENALRTRR